MSKQRKRVESKVGKQYWLLITSRGYWAHLQKHGFWSFASSKHLDEIKVGDTGVVYLTADGGRYDSAIGGVVQFTGAPTTIEKTNTLFDALYPSRMPMNVERIFDPPILFKPLVQKVSFISNTKNYGGSLQNQPMKPITLHDYQILVGET